MFVSLMVTTRKFSSKQFNGYMRPFYLLSVLCPFIPFSIFLVVICSLLNLYYIINSIFRIRYSKRKPSLSRFAFSLILEHSTIHSSSMNTYTTPIFHLIIIFFLFLFHFFHWYRSMKLNESSELEQSSTIS